MIAGSGGSSGADNKNYYGTTEILDDVEDRGVLVSRAEIGAGATLDGKGGSGNNMRSIPLVVEWWDMELLPSKLKKQVASYEGKALSRATQSKMQQLSKTKKRTKTTKRRREQKQRELQDL